MEGSRLQISSAFMLLKQQVFGVDLTIDWVILSTQLLSELTLVRQLQLGRNGVVGLGQNLHAGALQIVAWSELRCGTTTECDRGRSCCRSSLQRVQDQQLNGTRGSTREIERELDLPPVIRRELGQDDKTRDLAILGGGVMVLSVFHILPGVHIREMDLLALAVLEPVLNPLIDLLLDVFGNRGSKPEALLARDITIQLGSVTYKIS